MKPAFTPTLKGARQIRHLVKLAVLCVLCVYYFVTSVVSAFLQSSSEAVRRMNPLTTEGTEIQPTKDTEKTTDLSCTPSKIALIYCIFLCMFVKQKGHTVCKIRPLIIFLF